MLREVNHRVKNNLASITGLLHAARYRARVEDQATYQSTMDDLIGRVRVTPDQAHSLTLVISELATNTVKHALGERDALHVGFQIAFDDDIVRCEFRDDGPGYPEDALRLERYNVSFDLIQSIVRDNLGGELALHNDHGAVALVSFRCEALSQAPCTYCI